MRGDSRRATGGAWVASFGWRARVEVIVVSKDGPSRAPLKASMMGTQPIRTASSGSSVLQHTLDVPQISPPDYDRLWHLISVEEYLRWTTRTFEKLIVPP